MARAGRRRLSVTLGAVSALVISARSMAQDPGLAREAVIIECRIGAVASAIVEGRMRGDTLVLPTRPVRTLVGMETSSASVEWNRPELSLPELRELIHADVVFDPMAAVVQIADSGTLPVSRRAARARARAELARAATEQPSRSVLARERVLPSAVSLAYSGEHDGAAAVIASMRLERGVADVSVMRARERGTRVAVGWSSAPTRWFGGARFHVGAADTDGNASTISLTNAPIERDDALHDASAARADSGAAELELFQDDVLVAADSIVRGDRPRLDVLAWHGVHAMRLIAYDSTGTAHVVRWTTYLPEALLPTSSLRYSVQSRACLAVACARPRASIAFAPSDELTLGARFDRDDPEIGRSGWTSSASLDARVGSASALSMRASTDGVVAGELRIERGNGQSIVLRTASAGAPQGGPLGTSVIGLQHRTLTASGSWRVGRSGDVDVVAGGAGTSAVFGTSVSATNAFGALRSGIELISGALRCANFAGAAMLWGRWMPRVLAMMRSAAFGMRLERRGVECGGTSSGAVDVLLPALRWGALDLSASWASVRGAPRRGAVSLTLRRRLGDVVAGHAELSGSAGARTVRSGISGTVTLDVLQRRVTFASDAAGATTVVHGVVFADDDGNGRRDPGEHVIAGALVRVGDVSGVSDESGVFVTPALATDRTVRVTVDSISVEDQGYVPGAPLAALLVSRAPVRVDVPLRPIRGGAPS